MKKLLIFLMAFMLICPLAACNEGDEQSSTVFSAAESLQEESSKTESKEESSKAEASVEESAEESTDELEIPEFIANFVSIGTVDTKVNASSSNSIRLTGIDSDPVYGSIVLFTADHEALDTGDTSEYAVAVFEYNPEKFGYVKTAFAAVGEAESVSVPDDGFVIAAHSYQEAYIAKLETLSAEETVFPHGLHLYTDADYTVSKAETAPEIDGAFSVEEWGEYIVDEVNAENPAWSYAQFETNNYYSTATYYTAYDEEYLYLCVVVDSPYHYCPIETTSAGDMWQYECIQVKVSSEAPDSDYILENFDHVANGSAVKDGIVRSYGFAVNDNGETCYYESGYTSEFTGKAACSRDDASQLTVYEVAIPFAEFGITPESELEMGLTFSINSTNEEDIDAGIWKNITYRNGGGVIGRNDWSKIPVITLE